VKKRKAAATTRLGRHFTLPYWSKLDGVDFHSRVCILFFAYFA
jgi:hypothetical protein